MRNDGGSHSMVQAVFGMGNGHCPGHYGLQSIRPLSSLHHDNAVFTAAFYRNAVCLWCSVAMVRLDRLDGGCGLHEVSDAEWPSVISVDEKSFCLRL